MDEQRKLIFYPQWYNVIKIQPDSLRLAIYDAILQYKYDGIEPTDPMVVMAFGFIKQQIDADNQKYTETCNKNRENVNKRWNKINTSVNECIQNNTTEYDRIQPNTNDTNNNNNCNNNNNLNLETTNVVPRQNQVLTPKDDDKNIDYNKFVKYYNEQAAGKLPQVSRLTEQRKSAVHARLMEYSKKDLQKVVDKACASIFLIEHKFGFDWIMRPNNFPKVLEGNYDNRVTTPESNATPKGTDWSKPSSQEQKAAERKANAVTFEEAHRGSGVKSFADIIGKN